MIIFLQILFLMQIIAILILIYMSVLIVCLNSKKRTCRRCEVVLYSILNIWQRGKLVLLIDFENKVYVTIAKPTDTEGVLKGYVYPTSKVGEILLQEDGTVTKPDESLYYIKNWLPYNVEERTFKVLQGARNFEI